MRWLGFAKRPRVETLEYRVYGRSIPFWFVQPGPEKLIYKMKIKVQRKAGETVWYHVGGPMKTRRIAPKTPITFTRVTIQAPREMKNVRTEIEMDTRSLQLLPLLVSPPHTLTCLIPDHRRMADLK